MKLEFKKVTDINVSEEEYRAINKTHQAVGDIIRQLDIADTDSIILNGTEWTESDLEMISEFLYGLGEEVGFED